MAAQAKNRLGLGIAKLERTRRDLPDPDRAPELLLHLAGLRRVEACEADLRGAASGLPHGGPGGDHLQSSAACPALFRGLVGLVVGLAECQAASGSMTLFDGAPDLLFDHRTGLLRLYVQTSPSGMGLARVADPAGLATPLLALGTLAAFAIAATRQDDPECVRFSWLAFTTLVPTLWPDLGGGGARRALERDGWVPPPPAAAAAAAADEQAPPAPAPLAAALAADLARLTPDVSLADVRAAAQVIMACRFTPAPHLAPADMQQLVCLMRGVPAGRERGCFQLAHVWQAAGRCGPTTAGRLERLCAYSDAAQEMAAQAECWHAAFQLAQQDCSLCMQMLQVRGRREMALLPAATPAWCLQRGRAAVQRAEQCVRRLKAWLQPHKLAREREVLRAMGQQLEAAARAAPARDAVPRDLPRVGAEVCSHCRNPALHLRKCARCRSALYCGKDCQVADWKAGHREECAALAAQQGGSGGDRGGSAT